MADTDSKNPGRGLEGVVGLIAGAQEIQRYHELANGAVPEVRTPLESWYLNHSGDFFQGYGMAFSLDVISEYLSGQIMELAASRNRVEGRLYKAAEYFSTNHLPRAVCAAAISSGAVIAAETLGILNYPDPADIPAGIAGALLHLGIRTYVVARHNRNNED